MPGVFDRAIFDEPDSPGARVSAKRFKLAPTFVIDFVLSALYVWTAVPAGSAVKGSGLAIAGPSFALLLAILACYWAKVAVVAHLDRRGGDARAYVKSAALVIDGPYAWSRHPTYAIAMLQFLFWSALALLWQAVTPWSAALLATAFGVPVAFYLVNDRIVMPTEEAMLGRLHPSAYPVYAARVRRWFGRFRQDGGPPQPP